MRVTKVWQRCHHLGTMCYSSVKPDLPVVHIVLAYLDDVTLTTNTTRYCSRRVCNPRFRFHMVLVGPNQGLQTFARQFEASDRWLSSRRRIETKGVGLAKTAWLRYGPSTTFQPLLSRRFLLVQALG